MANNQFQFEKVDEEQIPDKVDERGFISLC